MVKKKICGESLRIIKINNVYLNSDIMFTCVDKQDFLRFYGEGTTIFHNIDDNVFIILGDDCIIKFEGKL